MKKLQIKMILIVFVSSVIVFSVMALGLYLTLVHYNTNQADGITSLISLNEGIVPDMDDFSQKEFEDRTRYRIRLDDEAAFRTRYFIVKLGEGDEISEVLTDHIASVDENEAVDLTKEVLLTGKETGYCEEYRYRVAYSESARKSYIIFLDCEDTINSQKAMLIRIVLITILFAIAVTIVFAGFSKRILEPFDKNQQMQKQFITDASHELKTPLAIISANADVLRYKNGDNEWIDNITSQTGRMARLINQLLILARMEEVGDDIEREKVNLSEVTQASVRKLEEIFTQKKVVLETDIQPDVIIDANRNQMENLTDILIENASKYVDENGKAGIRLYRNGKKAILEVFNTSQQSKEMDCEKIFERFYRTDKSRTSSTGGHGIGLSIAKRIADQHKGIIQAQSKDGIVTFTVKL